MVETRFRSLRLVALLYRVLAWVTLVIGVLLGLGAIVLGILSASAGRPSPALEGTPLLSQIAGLAGGLMAGLLLIVGALLGYLMLQAMGEAIHLGLAIEENTRASARYLAGESLAPSPDARDGNWA